MIDYCDYINSDDLSVGQLHYVQPFTIEDLQYVNQYHELINSDKIGDANIFATSLMREYNINMFDASMFNGILWRIKNLEQQYVDNYYINNAWNLTQETTKSFYRGKNTDSALQHNCLWLQTSSCEDEFIQAINLFQNPIYTIEECYSNIVMNTDAVIYGVFTDNNGCVTCRDIYFDNEEDETQNNYCFKYPICCLKRGKYEIELCIDKSIKDEIEGIKFYTFYTGNLYDCYEDEGLTLYRYDGEALHEIKESGFYTIDQAIDYMHTYTDKGNNSVNLSDKYDVCYGNVCQEVDNYFDVYYGFSLENVKRNIDYTKIIDYISSGKIKLLAINIDEQ